MIEFQNVSMAYKDRPVLNHVDLTIQDSEFFVLIGSSGCGKTTLLKSINKLLNVQKGKLLINGTPVDRIKTNQLPNLVGYVVQAGGLFPPSDRGGKYCAGHAHRRLPQRADL